MRLANTGALELNSTSYTTPGLIVDAGIPADSYLGVPKAIGKPLIKIGKSAYSTTAGDYYGIGFGYSPTITDYNCCEIGTLITDATGNKYGDIVFSTRPNSSNIIATERLRIKASGFLGVGTTSPNALIDIFNRPATFESPHINLSGQNWYSSTSSSTSGVSIILYDAGTGSKAIAFADSALLTKNTTFPLMRFTIKPTYGTVLDCVSTNGTTYLPLTIGNSASVLNLNASTNNIASTTATYISGPLLSISSTTTTIAGTTLNLNSTTTNITGTTLSISPTTTTITGTTLNLNSTSVNITSDITSRLTFPNDNTKVAAPTLTATGGVGTRILFWSGAGVLGPYAVGIDSSTLWFSSSSLFKFYSSGTNALQISGTGIYITGETSTSGRLIMGNNVWNVSTDLKNRLYFATNSTTYFGSQSGYTWRSAAEADIMTLNNAGNLSTYNQTYITKYTSAAQIAMQVAFNYLIFVNNWWYQGHTYGILNVWVSGGASWWSGRVHLTQNNGLNAVYADNVNNISTPTNYWDGTGGNYINFNYVGSTTLYYRFTA